MAVRLDFDFGMKVCENVNSRRLDEMMETILDEKGVDKKRFENEIVSVLSYLQEASARTPLYFVDDELMDLLSESISGRSISEKCLKRMIERRGNNFIVSRSIGGNVRTFPLLELTVECFVKTAKKIDAIGIFVPSYHGFGSEYDKLLRPLEYPSIFISPEKVMCSAACSQVRVSSLFKEVLFHELGHAYLYSPTIGTRNNGDLHYLIVEESFANAIAIDRFYQSQLMYKRTSRKYDPTSEIASLIRFINEQPLEYRGWYIFFSLTMYVAGYTRSEYKDMLSRLESVFEQKVVGIINESRFVASPVGYWSLFDPILFREIWRDKSISSTFFKALAEFILEDICL